MKTEKSGAGHDVESTGRENNDLVLVKQHCLMKHRCTSRVTSGLSGSGSGDGNGNDATVAARLLMTRRRIKLPNVFPLFQN